ARYQFGTTTINGLKRYPASIVERANTIQPGDPYSQTRLLRLQSRLQGYPYFRSVEVLTEPDPDHSNRLAIVVNVQEMSSQKIGLGVGVSTDSGPRGQVEYENLNIFDSNLRFTSALKLDTKIHQLNAQIERPRNESGYIDSLGISTKRTDIEGEITSQNSIAAKRTRRKGRIETSLVGQYLTEHQTVAGAPGDNMQALTLNYIWTYRDLNNRILPTKGYIFSTEIGGAAQALLSDQSFIRSRNRAIYYYPITQYDSLTLRGELGIVFARSGDGIPSEFLFRTGGDLSVRGYAYQSLGVTAGDAIVGGRYLATGSVEYTHWLTLAWGAALFYDLGNATDTPQNFRPVAGYGAGARWRSPIGPINLDLAYGEAIDSYRIHFSLGSAF
ncbi:MAG: BamA/TamA family outer membrane protein, partial [Sulfuriferula sp.]